MGVPYRLEPQVDVPRYNALGVWLRSKGVHHGWFSPEHDGPDLH